MQELIEEAKAEPPDSQRELDDKIDLFETLQEEIKEKNEESKEDNKFEKQKDEEIELEEFHDEF